MTIREKLKEILTSINSCKTIEELETFEKQFESIIGEHEKNPDVKKIKQNFETFFKLMKLKLKKKHKLKSEGYTYILSDKQLQIIIEKWSTGYKKSIDCNNPKGFSQKAHCAGRKKRQSGGETKSKSPFKK
jgi:hypothetical protein